MPRKTENKIWADLNTILMLGISYWEIEGWEITRSYQPTKGNVTKPTLLLQLMSTQPVGTAERNLLQLENNLIRRSKLWEQWVFRISAIKNRTPGKPDETTALDILGSLRDWLNSLEGAEAVRSLGYNSLLVNISPVPDYLTDTEVFEVAPYMELTLFLQQTHERTTPSATLGDVIIKGV